MKLWWRRSGPISGMFAVVAFLATLILGFSSLAWQGTVSAATTVGGPLPNLSSFETKLFNTGVDQFNKVWDPLKGLGPVFTQASCAACHNAPAVGGVSIQRITHFGTTNVDGTFNPLTSEGGDVLQPQSVSQQIPSCVLSGETVPADATIVSKRLPLPVFGDGLINSISENDILANAVDKGMGIHGVANMVPDENGVTHVGRFGRKAQFADLIQITSHAFLNDLGVTTPLLPNENLPQGQPIPANCIRASTPQPNDDGTQVYQGFYFTEYLAPNTPGTGNSNGQALFSSIGCALCHVPTFTTPSRVTVQTNINGQTITSKALSNQQVNLYSDLLLHDLGASNGDGIVDGLATGTQWRTTPLWGLGLRTSFMHDGNAKTLNTAIARHGGEASQVIANFNALDSQSQSDLLAFLQSL